MARKRQRPVTRQVSLVPQSYVCEHCGGTLWIAYRSVWTITTLDGLCQLLLTIRRCHNAVCQRYRWPCRPEEEGHWALPHGEFGLDIIALIGTLRYKMHHSIPEIHQELCKRGVVIAERTVTNLLARYDELVTLHLTDQTRLRERLTSQGCQHALCNVHLLRDLVFVEETTQQPWARQMQTVLLDLKILTDEARAAGQHGVSATLIEQGRTRYREVVREGEQANPPPTLATIQPKRGRRKQSAARNLLDRLIKHEDAVLAFLLDLAVPFDNSQAERDIRMVKVQQKVSGCFRSWNGAVVFCRIRGYLSTLRKQGLPLLSALQQTLAGHPLLPTF